MATHFAQVLFFRSFYVCFPSGHYFTLVSIFAKDGQRYICARLLSIEALLPNFMFRQLSSQIGVVLSRDRLVVTLSIRLLIDFDILLDRRFIYIDAYQVFLSLPPHPGSVQSKPRVLFITLRNRPIVLYQPIDLYLGTSIDRICLSYLNT